MNSEVMKRRIAAMLCCAVLTAGMPMGALAEDGTQTPTGAEGAVTEGAQAPEAQPETETPAAEAPEEQTPEQPSENDTQN